VKPLARDKRNSTKRKQDMKVPNPRTHLEADGVFVQPVIPAIETTDDVSNLLRSVPQFASLPTNHIRILIEISSDILSEETRSDIELAEAVGCDRKTVYNARSNPRFASCLGILVIGIARGRSDSYLRWTEAAAKDGKVGALKLLWELTGLYVRTSRNYNLNIEAQVQQAPQTFEDAFDHFLIALGTAGYSAERITARYNELRARGAFG